MVKQKMFSLILIAGLGLGCISTAQAEKPKVSEMTKFARLKKAIIPALGVGLSWLFLKNCIHKNFRYPSCLPSIAMNAHNFITGGAILAAASYAKNSTEEDKPFPVDEIVAGSFIGLGIANITPTLWTCIIKFLEDYI